MTSVVAWALFVYLLLLGTRYLFAARLYLTCALQEVTSRPLGREQISRGESRILSVFDADLTAAGFRHAGFAEVTPLLTYYQSALVTSIFVHERIPAYAFVRRTAAPEYGRLAELTLSTELENFEVDTVNTRFSTSFVPPRMRLDGGAGLSVEELVALHEQRVAAAGAHGAKPLSLERAINTLSANLADVRTAFRERRFTTATSDPALDRFTLLGAFSLVHASRRVFGRARAAAGPVTDTVDRKLRVEADLCAMLHVAEHPAAAPGTPWPLITVIGTTALLSFVAMAALWDASVAALILAVVILHEAGHAFAMRTLGYRDVHVFFVPLLGAVTVGRPAATTVRDRLALLLAGPVPGLWLAVALLVLDSAYGPVTLLRISALALLVLNGLNLLPFTPLDGGRALEALSRPESLWRVIVHGVSAAGLLGVALVWREPVIGILGAAWVATLPRQLAGYRLRRLVAQSVQDRTDSPAVLRAALEAMTTPRYTSWRAPIRHANARAIARQFSESLATPSDRRWGVIAYVWAWIPVVAAAVLWMR